MRKNYLFLILLFIGLSHLNNMEINNKISNGPLTKESYFEMLDVFQDFINLTQIKKNQNTSQEIGFLSSEFKINYRDFICSGCEKLVKPLQGILLKYGVPAIIELNIIICSTFMTTKNECQMFADSFGKVGASSIIEHYMNPNYICTMAKMCENKNFKKLNPDEYAKRILADKPKINKNEYMEINPEAKIWKVLHITDIHVDLKYQEGSNADCPDAICCRKENEGNSSLSKSLFNTNSTIAGKYGFVGKCDLPLVTLENFAEKVFTEIKPDFVIWTGDNPNHDYLENAGYDITKLFTNMIKIKYNYTLPVYPSIGNHDNYPANSYDPLNYKQKKEFLTSYGNLFRDWIGEEGYESFINFGGYTKLHPDSNLRVISINCFLCYSYNFYLIRDPTDPESQIEWIENKLREAEKNKEVVYIISHSALGDVTTLSECAKRFKALIERFSHIIRGQFYGHSHMDEVKINTNYFDRSIVSSVSYIAPSLTTYPGNFPSFRIFDIDSDTKLIRDYTQYFMNVTKANEESIPRWEEFYKASELYDVKFLNETEKIYGMTQKIKDDKQVYEKLLKVFFNDGPLFKKFFLEEKMQRYLWCRLNLDIYREFIKCTGYYSWYYMETFAIVIEYLSGTWYERLSK